MLKVPTLRRGGITASRSSHVHVRGSYSRRAASALPIGVCCLGILLASIGCGAAPDPDPLRSTSAGQRPTKAAMMPAARPAAEHGTAGGDPADAPTPMDGQDAPAAGRGSTEEPPGDDTAGGGDPGMTEPRPGDGDRSADPGTTNPSMDSPDGLRDPDTVDEGVDPEGEAFMAACQALVSEASMNWRDSVLQTDQAIVTCLANSLGRPVGYGEAAVGGYDPDGGSRLTVITRDSDVSVEQQLADAISGDDHNWIVFDKRDFAEPTAVALYRLGCGDPDVLSALGVDDPALCTDHSAWCAARGVSASACPAAFFNDRLNDKDLPIRNLRIGSNKTIDGRHSHPYFLFSGFAIGADSGGEPLETSNSVIVTNLSFQGAGHTEDHGLDPDMIRATGASHDIWIHQNTFDLTGDAAFDVKVGAHDITISFNRVKDVKRASLHGSSDSREINAQITTTMHHNAFITSDALYDTFGGTGRRVPLIRRGQSHLFNNVFYGYRKDVLSVRVGARVAFEDNLFLANPDAIGDDDLEYLVESLLRDYREGGLRITGSRVALSDASYRLQAGASADLSASFGSTPSMGDGYSQRSRDAISANRLSAGQELVDYVMATAGKGASPPFNSR